MNRIYLSGPMSNLPDFNYPAFHAAAAELRALGYHVENPAENDPPPCGSWDGYMRMALRQMLTCELVAVLPGWGNSRGAHLEVRTARALSIEVITFEWLLKISAGRV